MNYHIAALLLCVFYFVVNHKPPKNNFNVGMNWLVLIALVFNSMYIISQFFV